MPGNRENMPGIFISKLIQGTENDEDTSRRCR